ncbi:hypothetical protein CYLTODRAFT_493219 [Cylindrobasidium torrendii FP15055 ss-10]|uniref:Uncharacterized protein n=1 Tax=Cylindrobasidium torrendii FP15055 ss-10 TaxID=1314674 RepID=A0A0D7B2A3_9AGAR|nr:hypothetical protein CYLTODRAFT_493219 [Cylindrobasidium torrendii FP15055 ss-10]
MNNYLGTNITLSVLYVPYALLLVLALHRTRLRVKSQPSNIYSAHRQNVLGGATLSWSYIVLIAAVVLMFIFTTVAMVFRWIIFYMDHLYDDMSVLTMLLVAQVPLLMMGLNVLLADIILIWRSWIIHGRAVWVVLFPSIGVVADIVGLVLTFTERTKPTTFSALALPVLFPAISLVVTGYCTIVIAIRIMRLNRLQGGAFWAAAPVLQIIVESAMLYSAALVLDILSVFVVARLNEYSQVLVLVTAGMCPTWILTRIISGQSSGEDNRVALTDFDSRTDETTALEMLRKASRSSATSSEDDVKEGSRILHSRPDSLRN